MMTSVVQPLKDRQHCRTCFIIVASLLIGTPLGFSELTYGTDTWRQADTASIAHHFFHNGFRILYPQIFWGGNGPGYVEAEFQLYTFITAFVYCIAGEHLWLGRLVSLCFSAGTLVFFSRLACRLLGERGALYSLSFLVISPLFIRYSATFMPEAAVLFFYVAALFLFQEWLDRPKRSTLLWAAAMTSLAILVKPTAIHVGLLFLFLVLEHRGTQVLKRGDLWIAGALSLLPAAAWYLHARDLYLTYGNTFGLLSGGDNKFGRMSDWLGLKLYLSIARLETIWVFAGMSAILFLIGLVLARKEKASPMVRYGVLTVILYYLIVARYAQESWGIQYHIFILPFAALGVGMGVEWIFGHVTRPVRISTMVFFSIATVAGSGFMYRKMMSPEENALGKSLVDCAAIVQRVVPADQRIIASTTSTSVVDGVQNNYQEPTIFFYARRYGWSLPADWHTVERIEQYRKAGGRYLVIYSAPLLRAHPALMQYLGEQADQLGPGVEAGCGLYHFRE